MKPSFIINNRSEIEKILEFTEGTFYFISVIQSRKENPTLRVGSHIIKNYYINSLADLDKYWNEITLLAKQTNSRVYFLINRRDYSKLLYEVNNKISKYLINNDHAAIKYVAEDSVTKDTTRNESKKKWILDIDMIELDTSDIIFVREFIKENNVKVYANIDTINGYHIIVAPFNVLKFPKKYNKIIHKDNLTLMYYENNN